MTIKTHPLRFGQKGFTLIEIVMVLVLLGILAAVAVPKYFDLKDEAEKRAMETVKAEFYARYNARFAQEILSGSQCGFDLVQQLTMIEIIPEINNELKGKYSIEYGTFSGAGNDAGDKDEGLKLYVKAAGSSESGSDGKIGFTFVFPDCAKQR